MSKETRASWRHSQNRSTSVVLLFLFSFAVLHLHQLTEHGSDGSFETTSVQKTLQTGTVDAVSTGPGVESRDLRVRSKERWAKEKPKGRRTWPVLSSATRRMNAWLSFWEGDAWYVKIHPVISLNDSFPRLNVESTLNCFSQHWSNIKSIIWVVYARSQRIDVMHRPEMWAMLCMFDVCQRSKQRSDACVWHLPALEDILSFSLCRMIRTAYGVMHPCEPNNLVTFCNQFHSFGQEKHVSHLLDISWKCDFKRMFMSILIPLMNVMIKWLKSDRKCSLSTLPVVVKDAHILALVHWFFFFFNVMYVHLCQVIVCVCVCADHGHGSYSAVHGSSSQSKPMEPPTYRSRVFC